MLTTRAPRKVSTRLQAVKKRIFRLAKRRRLETFEARKVVLEARLKALQFEQTRRGRKNKYRCDYIMGDAVLKAVSDGVIDREFFARLLDDFVTVKSERTLLGLPANPSDFAAWYEANPNFLTGGK